jgi:tRNA G18 (ribose-2'-O)-methylase SpoU
MIGDRPIPPLRIQSLDDPRVAEYRDIANPAALVRAGLFVAEGRFVVARLLAQDRYRTRSLLLTPTAFDALFGRSKDRPLQGAVRTGGSFLSAEASAKAEDPPIYIVEQPLMDEIVGFNIHRGCLALAERPSRQSIDDLPLGSLTHLLVMEGVNNPDNVGGLFRSAAAFGVEAVVLGPSCGDPLYRKAIRTSMAATLQVPFVEAGDWSSALTALRAEGLRLLALSTSREARPLGEFPRDLGRVALMVGNEGQGLSAAALAAADDHVRIPMTGGVDSLNVTVATSIALYHFSSRNQSPL